ncbi:non-ribosomal peptide synthetase [Thalassomonas sp. RHCl1]|uniref:non-ribosomal peptide synthetase n=1 Tax=Thalassomonas sp. RHCl1 TaxID=2995320 RepID=UPI00248CE00C|nr:non-ribosomal peptide synthetase [Thalassomonas sp. RHCl1]
MNMEQFIDWCIEKSISFSLQDGQIKVHAKPGALTPQVMTELKARQGQLLAWLKEQDAGQSQNKGIRPRPEAGSPTPLSWSQQRLWVIDQLEQGSAHYNMLKAFEVEGELEEAWIEKAFATIVQRHEVLHSVFENGADGAVQVPQQDTLFRITCVDISDKSDAGQTLYLQQLTDEESRYNFNLAQEVPLRVFCIRRSDHHALLLINMHHIASDGWSMSLLFKEFLQIYRACRENIQDLHSVLPRLPIQYADYALWQRQQLEGDKFVQELDFWRNYLRNVPQLHNLPLDKPRPARQSYAADVHWLVLDNSRYQALLTLAEQQNVTLFMLLQTAFALLLSRYSGESDIVMGVPNAGRNQRELESLIGFFINTLPFRTELTGNPSFEQLLKRNKEQTLEIFSHQSLPFELLVEELKLSRELSFNPLCQVKFLLESRDNEDYGTQGLDIKPVNAGDLHIRFDLDLTIIEQQDALQMSWCFKTDLFTKSSIEGMALGFEQLLTSILQNPATPVNELSLLDDSARQALLALGSGKPYSKNQAQTLLELFGQQVITNPDAIAAADARTRLSYARLNQKANRLADFLLEQDVEPGENIAIFLERTPALLVAMLGVLKAGAAYIPLDPNNSATRVRHILDDAGIEFVLTTENLLGELPIGGLDVITLDGWQQDGWHQAYADSNPDVELSAQGNAYLIYTSGSTGLPNGVPVGHAGLLDYCLFALRHYYDKALSGSTLVTSHSFDISVPSLFLPLLTGDSVQFLRCGEELEDLAQRLPDSVSPQLFRMTPMHVKALLVLLADNFQSQLAHVFVIGGESFPVSLARQLQQCFPASQIYNHYGPTEAVVGCSIYDVTANIGKVDQVLPIGKPMDNHQLYLLDEHRQPVPGGLSGELYIGGAGVVAGYLNRPELNSKRFIGNPFGPGKLYATGDRARWNRDGQLEFIGRCDDQVKIRGFRVEPGEIESALKAVDGVNEAVVTANYEAELGYLVAYVVLEDKHVSVPDSEQLRRVLKVSLPDYMVPAAFVPVQALPLNANGKIDKKALPEVDISARVKQQYLAPRSDLERTLVNIWQDILRSEKIGIEDNFFASGGDSILSIQTVAKASKQGLHFTTRQLFEYQTIAELAPHVQLASNKQAIQEASTGSLALLPVQRRFLRESDRPHHYNQSVLLKVPEALDLASLKLMLRQLIKRHDGLRLKFSADKVSDAFFEDDLDKLVGETVTSCQVAEISDRHIEEVANKVQAAMHISRGPLMQLALISSNSETRLLWVCHHLLVDGISWRILIDDLHSLWQQSRQEQPLALPAKTSSLQQWSEFLADYANSDDLARELDFWQQQSRQIKPLFATNQASEKQTFANLSIEWDTRLTEKLLASATRAYQLHINELLLSGFLLGFNRWQLAQGNNIAQQSAELSLLMEGHGREALCETLDLSQTVGWFTSKYPLYLQAETGSISRLVKAVKEQCRGVPANGIGFGILSELRPDAELLGQTPDIVFNYLGQFDQLTQQVSDIAVASEPTGNNIADDCIRSASLLLNGLVNEGKLRFEMSFDSQVLPHVQGRALADAIHSGLTEVIEHCCQIQGRHFTPSDFPLAQVEQGQLEELEARYRLADIYPATGMQSGLLYHSELSPGAYTNQMLLQLKGLDISLFYRTWQLIIARHDILRTAFTGSLGSDPGSSESGYLQVVVQEAGQTLGWQEHDLRHLPKAQQLQQIEQLRGEDKQAGFDICQPPLMRFTLFRLDDETYQILWSHHHALWDGWCTSLLFGEVWTLYQHLIENTEAAAENALAILPPVTGFKHYLKWLGQQPAEKARAFWLNYLAPVEEACHLPLALPGQPLCQGQYHMSIDPGLTARLEQMARDQHTTVNVLLQLAWAYLLRRYCNSEQVVFGSVVSGRPANLPGVDTMLGLFINTLPVVVDFAAHGESQSSVSQSAADLHKQQVQADEFAYLPLSQIQKCSTLSADLFDTLFVFENYPASEEVGRQAKNTALVLDSIEVFEGTNYPVTLVVQPMEASGEQPAQIQLTLNTRGEFAQSLAADLLPHLLNILTAMTDSPEVAMAQLPMIAASQQQQNVAEVNAPDYRYPTGFKTGPAHRLFEQQAQHNPARQACVFENNVLSYQQLNQEANRLAHELIAKGVTPGTLVGLSLERSLEMAVAILAILKAGGAYVPLDPSYPQDRLDYMIADSDIRFLVTQQSLEARMSKAKLQLVYPRLSQSGEVESGHGNIHNPELVLADNALAYVIYTSGSTGKPKGVLQSHANIVRLFATTDGDFAFNEEDVWLLFHSISFDFSVWEFWGALLFGGKLVIPDYACTRDPEQVAALCQQQAVSVLNQTPGAFKSFSQSVLQNGFALEALRCVVFGGEALQISSLLPWWDSFNEHRPRLVNMYGITETTVHASYKPVCRADDHGMSVIGQGLGDQVIYLLDSDLKPVPTGCVGEIYVGGAGLAVGYLNRELLTRERFIDNPFVTAKMLNLGHTRLYKTGDLARQSESGELFYLGRNDAQIKLRGFRIETGEVERAIINCPLVENVAIVLHSDESQRQQLVAYIVPENKDEEPGGFCQQVKQQISASLPEYMVPGIFVAIDSLPLTVNGKLDKSALPAPVTRQVASHYVAPSTDKQQALSEIWAELLKIPAGEISIESNFFELGGDSILSIQVISRARRAGIHLTVRQLFENPTIAALAELEQKQVLPASQTPSQGEQVLLPIQQWFFGHQQNNSHYNQAVLLVPPSDITRPQLSAMVEQLLLRHDVLRLAFDYDGNSATARYRELTPDHVQSALVWHDSDDSDLQQICNRYQQSLDIKSGPLFKAVYIRGTEDEQARLLLVCHHLAVDGVSWRILLSDLQNLWSQVKQGAKLQLGPKTSSYQQWAQTLLAYADSEHVTVQKAFWLGQLKLRESAARLPACAAGHYATTQTASCELSRQSTGQLLSQCNRAYRTKIDELLLSALYLGMHSWNGSATLSVELEYHGREDIKADLDLSETLGWFTNLHPLVIESRQQDPAAVIKQVKESLRAIPDKGLGYGLMHYLKGDEELLAAEQASSSALTVLFNYLGQLDQALAADGDFSLANEAPGQVIASHATRERPLALSCKVLNGQLLVDLHYSSEAFTANEMNSLVQAIELALQAIIDHCLGLEKTEYTVSDFPMARISTQELDQWQQQFDIADIYPATPMQTGMLYHSLLEDGAYVVQICPVLSGALQLDTFKKAWQQVIARYDIFRTLFVENEQGLHQLVVNKAMLQWYQEDISDLSEQEQQAHFEAFRREDEARGFDMQSAPLTRVAIFQLGKDRYQLLWNFHHMLLDGWCTPIVFNDVMAFYRGLLADVDVKAGQLLPAPANYRDYISWLEQQDMEAARQYWRDLLVDVSAPTPLIVDKLPTEDDQAGYRQSSIMLDESQTNIIKQFAREHGTTLNTLVQLAWAYLLYRYSGEQQVVFGNIISGRSTEVENVESMVGLFINTIPLKVSFGQEQNLADSLKSIHRQFMQSNEYGYLSLLEIQRASELPTNTGLFDSLLVFENYPVEEGSGDAASGIEIEASSIVERTNYPLTLLAMENDGLRLRLDYLLEQFSELTIERILGHLKNTLLAMPGVSRMADIAILSENEQLQISQWNNTRVDYPIEQTLQQLFLKSVVKNPDAVAIKDQHGQMSYGELFVHAFAVCKKLCQLEVQTGELVAVRLPKGRKQVVATLGIMMAGGAYLPLESKWPQERCENVVKKAGCRYTLLDNPDDAINNTEPLDLCDIEVIPVDIQQEAANFENRQKPTDLAYVIFTSGSTGQPKGVAIEHRSAVNTLLDINARYDVTDKDKVLAVSALSFDLSVYDIFGLLAAGGQVIFPHDELATDPGHWLELTEAEQVTVWDTVPVSAALLVEQLDMQKRISSAPLKLVMMSGDWIDPGLPKRLWDAFPGVVTYSLGGATEGSIWSINYPITEDTGGRKSVPYGKPLSNQRFYIVNQDLQLSPVGVPGELCIAGDGVARCYYGDETLSAERFVYHHELGQKLYRTGDLGRYLSDGNIEFIGRADHQIKIRGFRIELGEIEQQITACKEVESCVVAARTDSGGEKYLVAWVIEDNQESSPEQSGKGEPAEQDPGQRQQFLARQLRSQLQQNLPEYMLPTFFVFTKRWPLTANGKVDMKSLPGSEHYVMPALYQAPETEEEQQLLEIWAELLDIPAKKISIAANFFELGGHSLLAIRMVSRMEDVFGQKLALRQVYNNNTIKALAQIITRQKALQLVSDSFESMDEDEIEEFSL